MFTYNIDLDLDLDLDGDAKPEHQLLIHFGRSDRGESGVHIENLPGAGAGAGKVSGPVEKVVSAASGPRF